MRDQNIPALAVCGGDRITLNMKSRPVVGRLQIAGPRIMTVLTKRPSDDARALTGDENPHHRTA